MLATTSSEAQHSVLFGARRECLPQTRHIAIFQLSQLKHRSKHPSNQHVNLLQVTRRLSNGGIESIRVDSIQKKPNKSAPLSKFQERYNR